MTEMIYGVPTRAMDDPIIPRWWRNVDRWSLIAVFVLFFIGLLLGMAAFAKSDEFLKDGIKTPDLKTLEAENKDLKNRLTELEEIHRTPEIQLALLEIEANKIRKKIKPEDN